MEIILTSEQSAVLQNEGHRDPTAAAVRRPWAPMTPEQLDALRPQNKQAAPETPPMEAKRIAYQSGVSALEGLVLRIQELEFFVAELRMNRTEMKLALAELKSKL
jgi:hypothetical protein